MYVYIYIYIYIYLFICYVVSCVLPLNQEHWLHEHRIGGWRAVCSVESLEQARQEGVIYIYIYTYIYIYVSHIVCICLLILLLLLLLLLLRMIISSIIVWFSQTPVSRPRPILQALTAESLANPRGSIQRQSSYTPLSVRRVPHPMKAARQTCLIQVLIFARKMSADAMVPRATALDTQVPSPSRSRQG